MQGTAHDEKDVSHCLRTTWAFWILTYIIRVVIFGVVRPHGPNLAGGEVQIVRVGAVQLDEASVIQNGTHDTYKHETLGDIRRKLLDRLTRPRPVQPRSRCRRGRTVLCWRNYSVLRTTSHHFCGHLPGNSNKFKQVTLSQTIQQPHMGPPPWDIPRYL